MVTYKGYCIYACECGERASVRALGRERGREVLENRGSRLIYRCAGQRHRKNRERGYASPTGVAQTYDTPAWASRKRNGVTARPAYRQSDANAGKRVRRCIVSSVNYSLIYRL